MSGYNDEESVMITRVLALMHAKMEIKEKQVLEKDG
jgi:hypothetical protein